MNIDKILETWEQDTVIDHSALDRESSKIPQLHAKYLKWLFDYKRKGKQLNNGYKQLEILKYEYFNGRLPMEKMSDLGWRPFPHKILKNDVQHYIDSDKDLLKIKDQLDTNKDIISTIDSIIGSINRRSFTIKNAIEFLKFTNGVN